jgi:transcriptional regulator with XRE-family HTH domain
LIWAQQERLRLGWSQKRLAHEARVSIRTVRRLEHEQGSVSLRTREAIKTALSYGQWLPEALPSYEQRARSD